MGLPSFFYKIILSARSYVYKKGLKKPCTLPAKVISVGNLTLGGTGKTPLVISIASELKERHYKPCVLTRGYKGRVKDTRLSTHDIKAFSDAKCVGDEAALMACRLGDIPVVKDKNRFLGGIFALGKLGTNAVDVFILDDGYQHWSLTRDMDILLIDASNPFGNGKLFPEGILREPLESMNRADIIIITKTDMVPEDEKNLIKNKIKLYNPDVTVYMSYYEPASLVDVSGALHPLGNLKNRKAYVFSALANPYYFESMLKSQGIDIVKSRKFRDHHFYSQRDVSTIQKEAEGVNIITTEKDMVKLKELELPENIYSLRVEFVIERDFYDRIADIFPDKND
ncbi:MAG: tetraacyldisaccharide 4'-kinase [Nitrospiraceae bacterium]|nr:MAG: tetraacyldisaccharide 4'-kinase [Nitrospiraceae bacterium]